MLNIGGICKNSREFAKSDTPSRGCKFSLSKIRFLPGSPLLASLELVSPVSHQAHRDSLRFSRVGTIPSGLTTFRFGRTGVKRQGKLTPLRH